MKALTAAEMRDVDRLTTDRFHIPGTQLMEAAGASVAEVFLEQFSLKSASPLGAVSVLCGKGNNGGDGFVVARHLKEEAASVVVYLFARPEELKGDAAQNFEKWKAISGEVRVVQSEADWIAQWPEVSRCNVIFDALLGTGMRGAAEGLLARAIEDVNRLSRNATAAKPGWIVAVDTPSGLPSDGEAANGPVIQAHLTVTFTAPKVGQLISPQATSCGHLVVREIGSPAALVEEIGRSSLQTAGPEEFATFPLQRAAEGHKGTYGHVLLVAGSVGKTGAAVLAGQAALRAGAGLVTVATPGPAQEIIASSQAEYMTEALPATSNGAVAAEALHSGKLTKLLEGKSVLALGPGLGTEAETQELIRGVVERAELPVVLDADGLNAFAGDAGQLAQRKGHPLVVTPHPGEMARLLWRSTATVQADRVGAAQKAARMWNAYVVLKGFHTIVSSPSGEIFVNTTGNAGLGKGGTGDVLTGVLAAMISQFGTADLLRVVALGVYLHGLAADLLELQSDASGILASEVAETIPYARRKLVQELQGRE